MSDLYRLITVFIVGLIEGLTEFLPISSTGHLILIKKLLHNVYNIDYLYLIVIQLGAICAIALVFWRRLYSMGIVCLTNFFVKRHYERCHLCFLHVLVGTLPGLFLGLFFFEKINVMFDLIYVVYGLIIGGMFLLIADLFFSFKKASSCISCIDNMTYFQAFLIGCFQCLAFFPGFSRSGATIGGGLLVGLNRRTSLEFSFFLAIPIICGATVLAIYRYRSYISMTDSFFLLVGCVVAFCVSTATVRFFLKIVQNISLFPFVIYRCILAIFIYLFMIV